jgi:hypothetical protein
MPHKSIPRTVVKKVQAGKLVPARAFHPPQDLLMPGMILVTAGERQHLHLGLRIAVVPTAAMVNA